MIDTEQDSPSLSGLGLCKMGPRESTTGWGRIGRGWSKTGQDEAELGQDN